MSLGVINLIIHEVQTAEGIELSETSRRHIERLVMRAVERENDALYRDKQYWMNAYLKREYPRKA
jgi:hypothetical protein